MVGKSFSQYLAEARAKQGVAPRTSVSQSKPLNFSAFQKKPEQPALDALSWIIDIASRPMRAVQNIPNQILNEAAKAQEAEKTGKDFDVWGAIGNVVTAPVRGFTSTNPEDQPYGAQLIEKATDVIGQANDPNYENVQDNVNPWVKGIGGFGLDVGLDPLTYVPFGVVASATRGAVAGAKAATGAQKISGAVKGIKVGDGTGTTAYKIGSEAKQMRPVGIDQWREADAFKKLNKAAIKQNIPTEAIFKFSDGGDAQQIVNGINSGIWAKAREAGKAVPENQYVTPETFLNTFRQNEKLIPQARAYDTRLESVSPSAYIAKQQRAAEEAAKEAEATARAADEAGIPRTETPVPGTSAEELNAARLLQEQADKPVATTIAGRMKEIQDEGKVLPVLREALNAKAEVTDVGRVKPMEEWIAHSIELSKADSSLRIPTGTGKSITATRLIEYNKLKDVDPGKLNARELARRDQAVELVQDAYDNYVASLGGTKAPKTGLKEWLAEPTNRVKAQEALGEKTLERVGVLREDTIDSAFKFLANAIENPETFSSVETFGRSAEQQFAKNVVNAYESRKVADTPAIAVESTSRVNSPAVAEINAANERGETLLTQSWAFGLESEEEARFVLANFKAYWAEKLLKRAGMPFTSPKGAKKSDPEMFKGSADWINQFNGPDQTILWRNIAEPTYARFGERNDFLREEALRTGDKSLRNKVIAGAGRATQAATEVERLFEASRRLLDQELGIAAWLGKDDQRIPMYLDQMIAVLSSQAFKADKSFNRHLMNMVIHNKETLVPMTNLQEAVTLKVLRPDMSTEELQAILRQDAKGAINILTDTKSARRFGFKPGATKPAPANGLSFVAKLDDDGKTVVGYYGVVNQSELESALVKLIEDSVEEFDKVIEANRVASATRTQAEYIDITNEQWNRVVAMVLGADENAAGLRMLANISDSVAEAGVKGRATFDAQANAAKDLADTVSENSIHVAQHYVGNEKLLAKVVDDAELGKKMAERNWKDADYYKDWGTQRVTTSKNPMNGVDDAGNVIDEIAFAEATARETQGLMLSRVRQSLMHTFRKDYGMEDVIFPWAGQDSNFSLMVHQANSHIANYGKLFGAPVGETKTTIAAQAIKDIATRSFDDPITKEAVDFIRPMMDYLFGTDTNRALTSVWLAEGANAKAFEAYITRAGKFEMPFDMAEIARIAKRDNISEIRAMLDNWDAFVTNMDNPLDFLERMNYAAMRFVNDKALAMSMKTIRGGTSTKPAVGFTKVGKEYQYMANPILAHLPEDLYVADELLSQIKNLEKMMMESSKYRGPLQNFVNDVYTPLLSSWKFNVTVLRLGHHIRNDFSNKSIQLIKQGGRNIIRSHNAAWKATLAFRKSNELDFVAQAKSLDLKEMPDANTVLFSTKRFGDVNVEKANEYFKKGGMFEGVATVEDIVANEGKGFIGKLGDVTQFKGTKAAKLAGTASEVIQWQNRAAYVIQFVMNNADSGLYKTEDALWEAAMNEARLAMPSNLMLTSKEKQIRLAIPFYGWFRQALPFVTAAVLEQPGRFMMIPKASFNLAIGMGVNPYQMYDPFPEDQPFPSFITDQMLGPVAKINGKYYTINPGFAPVDLANQFIPDPLRAIAGMSTPFIKVPGELLGGTEWSSGAPIRDMSDYWDRQLPGINYLSSMTGTSITGSVVSLLSGQGLDPQYAVEKGSKTPGDQAISVSNWFTGMDVQNVSKQSYIDYAKIEKRNKAAAEAKREAGTARNPF